MDAIGPKLKNYNNYAVVLIMLMLKRLGVVEF